MTNVFKFGRKVLTMGTVFSTILWSVGVSALVPAMAQAQTSCPAFQPGDMIKVTGRPAIYSVDANGKVLYFPSGDEFKSWNAGETYGGYTTVSQSCFDSLPVPTSAPLGVNFRPGSYVVKRPSSDQLYVVEPNNTLATITSAAAAALYGASYKVKTVADVFWPNYGNVRGTAVTEAKAHPGMLVSNGGKTYFVDSTGALREVTAAGFTANRFKQAFVHPIASTAGYTVGSQLTAFESAATDRTQTGVTTNTTPASTGAVTVSLASDNPAGTILASGTAFNPVLKLNLTAGAQAVSVTGLTIRKSGLAANNVVNGADVIDSSGVRHGNVASTLTSDNDLILLFTGSPINIPANSTQTVTIRVNVASSATSGTLQFNVVGPAAVTGATAGGSFPVSGNVFQIQSGTSAISAVTVTTTILGDTNVNVDATNEQDVTKFSIAETSSQENVKLKSLTLYNNGTASDSDVQDVQLVAQDGTVLATAQQVGKNVSFNLVNPYVIDKGTTKYVTVRAKVVGQTGRTIQFTIYNNYDIVLVGANTGASVLPSGNFPSYSYNTLTIQKGTLSFNKDVSSPSSAITPASNNVVLAKFFAKPTGEDMELRQVALTLNTSTVLTGSLTIKVNGSSVWSGSPVANGVAQSYTLSTYPVMTAGQNSYITVEGNIMSGVANGATTTVTLDLTQARRLITNDIIDPGVNPASGNVLTVQAASLKVTTLATPVAQSVVAGATNVTLANIELSGIAVSSGEDIKVSKLIVSDTTSSGAIITDIGNLVLYDANGNALATTASTNVNAASNTFSFATPIVVPKTGAITLTLKGDVLTGTSGVHTFNVALAGDVTATGVTTGNAIAASSVTVAGSGQGMTVATAGTLTLSVVTGGTSAPASDQVVIAGTTGVPVFAFKLTAQKEAIKVSSLRLTATGTLNTVNDLTNVKLSTSVGGTAFASVAQGVSGATGITFTFGGTGTDNLLPAAIQPGTPVTVYVTADVNAGGIARLGDKYKFSIASSTADVTAKGSASNASATVAGAPSVSALTYIEPFAVNVAATDPTSPITTLVAGSRIGTFKITNNGSTQVTITGIKFTNSGSTSTGPFALYYSNQNSSDYLNTAASTTNATVDFSNLATTFTIDGGAYRYVSVVSNKTMVTGDSYQLSIANVGDLVFSASEANLGYDYNNNGTLADTATGLVAADRATCATISKP